MDKPDQTDRAARRVLVTGAAGFIGYRVVRALLDEGAQVTALVPPEQEDRLNPLRGYLHIVLGDVWNPASLRGRARGHSAVIHLIGGVKPDPTRGLTFRHLNSVSARNVAHMAVNDGVPHFLLLSAAAAPLGVSPEYIESKREAERYLQKSGLDWTIIRAPTLYAPGKGRHPLYVLIGLLSRLPLIGLPLARYAPLSADTAARGIAALALAGDSMHRRVIAPRQLRRFGRVSERRLAKRYAALMPVATLIDLEEDDEPPFGWLPPPVK